MCVIPHKSCNCRAISFCRILAPRGPNTPARVPKVHEAVSLAEWTYRTRRLQHQRNGLLRLAEQGDDGSVPVLENLSIHRADFAGGKETRSRDARLGIDLGA